MFISMFIWKDNSEPLAFLCYSVGDKSTKTTQAIIKHLFGLDQSVEGSPPIVSGRDHSLLNVLCTPLQRMLKLIIVSSFMVFLV